METTADVDAVWVRTVGRLRSNFNKLSSHSCLSDVVVQACSEMSEASSRWDVHANQPTTKTQLFVDPQCRVCHAQLAHADVLAHLQKAMPGVNITQQAETCKYAKYWFTLDWKFLCRGC